MKRKRSGHWCWCCDRRCPNERFSGGGHARHLCRDCKKLGPAELAYRQAVINIQRLVPKQMAEVGRIAQTHPDARVQEYARGLIAEREQERRMIREEWDALERQYEEFYANAIDDIDDIDGTESTEDLDDIPF